MPTAPPADAPIAKNFPSEHTCLGGGVAIFHAASARVVVCFHTTEEHWFLPKGRRDVLEDSVTGAEREGYEESGYRNRILPLPIHHRQPMPHHPSSAHATRYVTEPVWTQLMPIGRHSDKQYILHWFVAETLPPLVEQDVAQAEAAAKKASASGDAAVYRAPPAYPPGLSLKERIALEPEGYEPPRHEGTSIQVDELRYTSFLLPVDEAVAKLASVPVQADVVRRGWEMIQLRLEMEKGGANNGSL